MRIEQRQVFRDLKGIASLEPECAAVESSFAGRNPKSGERVHVPAKFVPHFKAGKELRNRVDQGNGQQTAPSGQSAD